MRSNDLDLIQLYSTIFGQLKHVSGALQAFQLSIDDFAARYKDHKIDVVAGDA